jgi:hypothetical protein
LSDIFPENRSEFVRPLVLSETGTSVSDFVCHSHVERKTPVPWRNGSNARAVAYVSDSNSISRIRYSVKICRQPTRNSGAHFQARPDRAMSCATFTIVDDLRAGWNEVRVKFDFPMTSRRDFGAINFELIALLGVCHERERTQNEKSDGKFERHVQVVGV